MNIDDIRELVKETLDKIGYTKPTIVKLSKWIGQNAGIMQGKRSNKMLIGQELIDIFTDKEMHAVVLHEIGHLFHTLGRQGPQVEHFADTKAVELGACPYAIISGLKKVVPKELYYSSSNSHPSIMHRANYMSVKLIKINKNKCK